MGQLAISTVPDVMALAALPTTLARIATMTTIETEADTSTKCADCGSNGWVAKRNSLLGPGWYQVDCDTCGGFGWVQDEPGARP